MIKDFKIEYRENPIGIDVIPRFSWKLESKAQNVMQQCYQLQVFCRERIIWDSGVVETDQSQLILYEGTELQPMTKYHVHVQVWDTNGESGQSDGTFETGLLSMENWHAKWMSHTLDAEDTSCPVFIKDFDLERPIHTARLYATACGVYEAEVNGVKAGDAYLAPGWTSYHHRIEYQTYDITDFLKEGANVLKITVGNGWYKGYLGFDNQPNRYGDRTSILAMVCVEYEDGDRLIFGTDESWKFSTGFIASAELYHGETQDFTRMRGEVLPTVERTDLSEIGTIVSQESEMVRVTRRIRPIHKIITPKGEVVFDFGQNMAGFVEVKLPKLAGEKLKIRHAETLDKEGNFYTENLRSAKSEDIYIYDEKMEGQTVHPHFTFHGFRYIAVEGAEDQVSEENFTACVIHTDMQKTGSFHTDNEMVNQLQSNIEWGQRGNFVDIPTDCPQRDERLGWTGDAQVFCGTAAFNFNTALFFHKWLRDMEAEANPEAGVPVPHVVPNLLGDMASSSAWADAATIIPWTMYQVYGDKEMLAEHFPMMKMWVDFIRSKTRENGLWLDGFQYGDWLALDIEAGSKDSIGGTDKYLVANAYYAYSTAIVRDAAKVLGYQELVSEYSALYDGIINAMNDEYVTKNGRLSSETQTGCVLMLYFQIARPEHRARILQTLEENITAHHGHLTTGFVGTPYLCKCLSENGLHELADEIFMKEDFPGWLYAVKKGATTVWERWNSILPNGDFDESGMNSLNHYAYGSIGSWLYEKVAGIRPEAPGYKKIRIQPMLTKGMTEVTAEYESVYGTIRSAWICRNGKVTVDITIPVNTTAVVVLPEHEEEMEIGSGAYHYEFPTETYLEKGAFTMESTIGEISDDPLGHQMLEEASPGFFDSPMISIMNGMSLSDLIVLVPESKPLYESIVEALNAKVRKGIL